MGKGNGVIVIFRAYEASVDQVVHKEESIAIKTTKWHGLTDASSKDLDNLTETAVRWDSDPSLSCQPEDCGAYLFCYSKRECIIKDEEDTNELVGMYFKFVNYGSQIEFSSWGQMAEFAKWLIANYDFLDYYYEQRKQDIRRENEATKCDLLLMDENVMRAKWSTYWDAYRNPNPLDIYESALMDSSDIRTQRDPDGGTWYYDEANSAWLDHMPE